jgi:CRP/FNR family transcriptional regulator
MRVLRGAKNVSSRIALRNELALGQRGLSARFRGSPPSTLKAGELLVAPVRSSSGIYHLQTGWACQFRDLPDGRRAIVDIYLPGDVIGLDAVMLTQPRDEVWALTSITVELIVGEQALVDLMAWRPTALYIAWLLGLRQRRADRRLTTLLCLDARERLATMVLDFYTRSRRRKLTTSSIFYLPLTQIQIANYLGLSVVHANRVLRSLSDERIVEVEKHCVTILDLERLAKLAQSQGTIGSTGGTGEVYVREIPPQEINLLNLPRYSQPNYHSRSSPTHSLSPQRKIATQPLE